MTETRLVNRYFGAPWAVPALEGAVRAPTPIGQRCLDCDEEIAEDDRGFIQPCVLEQDEFGQWVTDFRPIHRECQFLTVAGHTYGWCRCTDYQGLTRRQGALALWRSLDVREGPPGFTCVHCGMTSHHPDDLVHRYCGRCRHFCDDV